MTEDFGFLQISDPKHISEIDKLLASKGTFVEMADILGLDKAVDFQGTNLRGVDFTGSDLRGFDFTGADLRGSHGVNLAYDHTTRLENADVQESPFGYIALERAVRKTNVDFEREYAQLKNSYWSDQLPQIHERIVSSPDRTKVQLMAMRLFVDAESNVVRGDMIRALAFSRMDREAFLSFLLYVCATRTEPVILSAAIDALGAFVNNRAAFETLLALTSHQNEMVTVAAWGKLVRSRHLEEARNAIMQKLAADASPLVRQAIAKGLAPRVGAYGRAIMANQTFSKALGLKNILTPLDFIEAARSMRSDRDAFRHATEEARMLAEALIDLGIPIRILETGTTVYIKQYTVLPREKGTPFRFFVEDYEDRELFRAETMREAVQWAKANDLQPVMPRVPQLRDKTKPDHWREASD